LLAFVKREVFAPEFAVTPETDLVAAGFDSMSLVRLLLFVEMTYGLWIPPEEIKAETLRDLRSLSAAIFRLLHAKSTASQRL
jgi:acyl carrier protein